MPKKQKDRAIPFVDNKGHTIRLSAAMTIRELVKIGRIKIEMVPEGEPIKDGWYRENARR